MYKVLIRVVLQVIPVLQANDVVMALVLDVNRAEQKHLIRLVPRHNTVYTDFIV